MFGVRNYQTSGLRLKPIAIGIHDVSKSTNLRVENWETL